MLIPLYISFLALPPTVACTSGRIVSPKAKAIIPAIDEQTIYQHSRSVSVPGGTVAQAGMTCARLRLILFESSTGTCEGLGCVERKGQTCMDDTMGS